MAILFIFNMDLKKVIQHFNDWKAHQLADRFFKHQQIVELLLQLPKTFDITVLGKSVEGRSIHLVRWGKGKTKIMLWSQMHGDEATGTMALFDLLNFLQQDDEAVKLLHAQCELFITPMVNPDGAARFTRRNAQQIDINRDFLATATPEAKLLKACRAEINPAFGFNLHDQLTLWSVSNRLKPATLSFLAPAVDEELTIPEVRKKAMLIIADIFTEMTSILPDHIGLFDDAYEPRAFGDNFQKAGTSTILIEAGGYATDFEKQEIRKFYFAAILKGLISIARQTYKQQQLENYFSIPKNSKQLFHILIHNVMLQQTEVSIGINYDETPAQDGNSTVKIYSIQDLGDLTFCGAYQTFSAPHLQVKGDVFFAEEANFELFDGEKRILAFENGKLV
jgi:hypothetical protein